MISDRGIVLRVTPYADSAKIIRCLSFNHGVIPLFYRTSKKSSAGHLQSGSFILYEAKEGKKGSMYTLKDARWDPDIPTTPLGPNRLGVWMFTVELLQKALSEGFAIPGLNQKLTNYYVHLHYGKVDSHPLIPLMTLSQALGISDVSLVQISSQEVLDSLANIGINVKPSASEKGIDRTFHDLLEKFMFHFSIERIDSLYLLD